MYPSREKRPLPGRVRHAQPPAAMLDMDYPSALTHAPRSLIGGGENCSITDGSAPVRLRDRAQADVSRRSSKSEGGCLKSEAEAAAAYFVPNMRSPASPRPGTI